MKPKKGSHKYYQAMRTRWHQRHPKMGATYSPRSLYRNLTVPYSTKPGHKRLLPIITEEV